MKKIASRSVAAVLLAAFLTIGLAYYVFLYITRGEQWATYYANSHIASELASSDVNVYDRYGLPLLVSEDGERVYNSDEDIRKSTLHTVGDLEGYIVSPALSIFREEYSGYGAVSGVVSDEDELHLSIDAEACAAALDALGDMAGTVGVYNYKTGEILCLVSTPTYDPESPPDLSVSDKGYEGVYVNRFLSASYTPGSIFKLLVSAAAIDADPDIFAREFNCEGSMILSGQKIICNHVHGKISFKTALAKSCNIAFAELAAELGADVLSRYAAKTGLCSSLSFQSVDTAKGKFDLTDANSGDIAWAGVGQYTDLVNPCAAMVFAGTIANGGQVRLPSLIAGLEGEVGEQALSSMTAGLVREMMSYNVGANYGTENFPGLSVCAKSGTAEVEGALPHAWFLGFIENEDHPYAFVVICENSGSGSSVAGSVANSVLQALVNK